jgi:hypothetical protein
VVGAKIGGRLIAEIAILLQRLVEEVLEFVRQIVIQRRGRGRMVVEQLVKDDRAGGSAERVVGRGHLVKDDAERKQVAARIEGFAARLLGRHVGDRAERGAGAGELVAFGDARSSGVAGS